MRHGLSPVCAVPCRFIYMDGKQLANDVAAGLLDLTLQQWQAMKRWVEAQRSTPGAILAVGDVFPLALACLASHHSTTLSAAAASSTAPAASPPPALPFAFMGTAKSEFYIRGDDARLLPSQATTSVERWWHGGGVYHPWERWLMAHSCCRLAAVRDRLTAQVLAQNMPLEEASPSASSSFYPGTVQDGSEAGLFRRGKVAYLGNPMMDHMSPSPHLHSFICTLRAWIHHRTTPAVDSAGGADTTAPHGASSSAAACQGSSSSPSCTPCSSHACMQVYSNWDLLTSSIPHLVSSLPPCSGGTSTNMSSTSTGSSSSSSSNLTSNSPLPVLFVCPIVPSLPPSLFASPLLAQGWLPVPPSRPSLEGEREQAEEGWEELGDGGSLQGRVFFLPGGEEGEADKEEHGRGWAEQHSIVAALEGPHEEGKSGVGDERGSAAVEGSSGGAARSGVRSIGGARAVLVLVRGGFAECAHEAHGALAMAGTASEQMVGLGKPVFIIPGKGPQFTAVFAEAQTRLLGKSVILSNSPEELGAAAAATMADAALLQEIAANGRIRMGGPGGARQIATAVLDDLLW
ncbi:unnamed protein product [Closterium sp. NIES-54]